MNPLTEPLPHGAAITRLRVNKKLAATDRGAIKLARQFGNALVCVRHRVDAEARLRFTTVELLVEQAQMQPRQPAMVNLRLQRDEYALKHIVRTAGGQCDSRTGLWRIPKRVTTLLRLTHRIVPPK
jgi:hypothetical protein